MQQGRSPLYVATERGHATIAELLVDKFKANTSGRTVDGSTLMHVAAQSGNPETALAFLKKGVPLNMPNKVCLTLTDCRTFKAVRLSVEKREKKKIGSGQ